MSDEQKQALRTTCRAGAPPREISFAQPGLADPGLCDRQRQGRGRQVLDHRQPRRRDGAERPHRRHRRRRRLRPLDAAHARHQDPAGDRRRHDRAAGGARREGRLGRDVRRGQPADRLARTDAAPRARSSCSPTSSGATSTSCCSTCRRAPATSRSRPRSCCRAPSSSIVTTPQLAAREVAERAGAIAHPDPASGSPASSRTWPASPARTAAR